MRHVTISCVCETRHVVEQNELPAYAAAVAGYKHVPDAGPGKRSDPWRPGEPLPGRAQDVPCGCGISFRVTWFALDREGRKTPMRGKRGVRFEVLGHRCIVEAFKDGSAIGAWMWTTDRFARGYMTVSRSEKERAELEATLRETLFGDRRLDVRDKIEEGPAIDKRTGKPLDQPSRAAHEARLLRDEINRIDSIGGKTVTVYGYME